MFLDNHQDIKKMESQSYNYHFNSLKFIFLFFKNFLKHNFKLIIRETNINPPKYKTFSQFLKFSLFNFLKKNLYNQAEYVIAINSKSRQELISLGIDKNKIKIFNNPSIKENFIIKAKKNIRKKIN